MNVILLDEHPPEDGRLGRHIKYALRNIQNVYRIHFSLFTPTLQPGQFSLYGEKGFRINPPFRDKRLFNIVCFNTMYLFPSLFRSRIRKAMDELGVDLTAPTVLHVHDPGLLKVAMMMKNDLLQNARLVYDRHEFFEVFRKKTQLPIPGIHRSYEIMARDGIDGVAHASLGGGSDLKWLFPGAVHTQVPNFPIFDTYNEAHILKKVQSLTSRSMIKLLYIGSLGPLDRDVHLLLKVASDILDHVPNTSFFFGGPTFGHDEELHRMMLPLQEEYGPRFQFHLGYVPRETTQQYTEDCHIGFYFIKPDTTYWVKGSPNKIFEYLRCGVIPVVRASIEFSDEISGCSLLFDRSSTEDEIISHVRELASDPVRCRGMMEDALSLSAQFTFDAVGPNYLRLYEQIWSDHLPSS